MNLVFLFISVFLASAVEFVEALTIVLAVGITRQWRSTLFGVLAASLALAVCVAAFGAALTVFVPIGALRLVVGSFLLVFGLQWVHKSVLRSAGRKALHDEEQIFERERSAAIKLGRVRDGFDWYAFTIAFKGVFLEGAEVAFIVVTFGSNAGNIGLATIGAVTAGAIVIGTGAIVHRPLSAVPENTLKFAVGLMLMTFGTFWAGEGLGVHWPGSDLAIVGLLVLFVAASRLAVLAVRVRPANAPVHAVSPSSLNAEARDGAAAEQPLSRTRGTGAEPHLEGVAEPYAFPNQK